MSSLSVKDQRGLDWTLTAGAVGLFSLAYYKYISDKKKSSQYPPGPKPLPLLGNMQCFPNMAKGETFDSVELELSKKHGLVYTLDWSLVLGSEMIVCNDPALAKKVMHNADKSHIYRELEPILGLESLVTAVGGETWSKWRKIFNPGFTPAFLKGMVLTMAEKANDYFAGFEQDINDDKVTNMLERSQKFASDVILAIAFGEHVEGQHPARVYLTEGTRLFSALIMNPLRSWLDFKAKWKLRRYGRMIDEEMLAILERRIASGVNEDNAKDILSLAVANMVKDGPMTAADKKAIVDHLKAFYFAGHDTTAIAISWSIWLLSQHPGAMEKARAEVTKHAIWKDETVPPTYEALQKCEYLDAIVKEALRLYPPATGLTRDGSNFKETWNGYSLQCKLLLVNVYIMHRHPSLWKEPDLFRPERFLDGSEEDINSKFLAFSRGPRDCIGKHFALLEAKLALAALVKKYDFECINPNEVFHYNLTNLPKNGCLVKTRHRLTSSA